LTPIVKAAEIIKKGGVVIFPTETLYGLGTNALNQDAIKRIFEIKIRPMQKVLPVIIGDISQLKMLVDRTDNIPLDLILDKFWPGPLSILFSGKTNLPKGVVNQEGYVCIRLTSHPVARNLCLASGYPLVATSANLSGKPSPRLFDEINKGLLKKVDMAINLYPQPSGRKPSTIIKFVGDKTIKIIRHGAISINNLKKAGLNIK